MSIRAPEPADPPRAAGAAAQPGTAGARQSLDGLWQFRSAGEARAHDAPLRPDANFEPAPIRVPGYWNSLPPEIAGDWQAYQPYRYPAHWQRIAAAWYRRNFRLDAPLRAADRVQLTFDAVAGRSTMWLNGTRLGTHHDSFLPISFDVTHCLERNGDNELTVLIEPPPQADGEWLQPCGSWVGWHLRGIWQSVHLDALPQHAIADIFVQPSVRRRELVVDLELAAASLPAEATVHLAIRDTRKLVKTGAPLGVRLGPETAHVRFTWPWPDARLWSPDDPHLYRAEVELRVCGQTRHRRSVRFGFREFWIEGHRFFLNGAPIRLFGDSWHYMGPQQQNPAYARAWFELARATGANVIRTHAMPYPPCYFELADELGMLLIDESAVYGSAGTLALTRPEFWENARDHVRRLVRRDRNHPSIIFWSACNETVWKGGEAIFPDLLSLGAEARRLDPTRLVSYDENDCALGGGSPVHAGHYGTPIHWAQSWRRDRPLILHEFSALYHGGPDNVAHLGDEAVYASFAARLHATGLDAARMFLEVRALGAASITPWNVNWYCGEPLPAQAVEAVPAGCTAGGAAIERIGARSLTLNYGFAPEEPAFRPNPAYAPLKSCYARRRCFVPHPPRQCFSGAMLAFDTVTWNDTAHAWSGRLRFALHGNDGPVAETVVALSLAALGQANERITLTAPAVTCRTTWAAVLTLQTADSAQAVFEERWPLHVHPEPQEPAADAREILLVGDEQTRLGGIGQVTQLVSHDEALGRLRRAPGAVSTIILARCPHPLTLQAWLADETVDAWLRGGGRLLALPDGLADDATDGLPRVRRSITRVFPREGTARLTDGLDVDHWCDWGPRGLVAEECYLRPPTGVALTPLDLGDPAQGLRYAPLVIVPRGAGQVVRCGLALLDRSGDTPAAALLLARLINAPLPAEPASPVAVIGADLAALARTVGLSAQADAPILLCAGGDPSVLDDARLQPEALAGFFAQGGALLVTALTPETVERWARRLDLDLQLSEDPCCNVARSGAPELLASLNNYDFCWVTRGEKQLIVRHTLGMDAEGGVPRVETVATRWEDFQAAAEQHKVALMYRRDERFAGARAALVEAARGAGRIVLCQLLLAEARGTFAERGQRILSRLVDRLGAARAAEVCPLAPRARATCAADGYITQWLVLGPFRRASGHPLDHPFVNEAALRPRAGASEGGCCWRRVESPLAYVELTDVFPGQGERDRVAYAAVHVWTAAARSLLLDAPDMVALHVGSDGGNKVILNGAPLGRFDFVRELVLDGDRVASVPLRRGWNLLVLKLHHPSGPWRFSARFLHGAGAPADDLRIVPDPPPEGV